jgi:hypothetical protein
MIPLIGSGVGEKIVDMGLQRWRESNKLKKGILVGSVVVTVIGMGLVYN